MQRESWRFVLRFLSLISEVNSKLSAKCISTIFSEILFKPRVYRSDDMLSWKLFTELLTLMINEHLQIFEGVDNALEDLKI